MPEIPDEIKKFLLDENHIYFTKILKEDELMNMNENVFYEISKTGPSFSITEQNNRNYTLNMISTRFCCCIEIIRNRRQIYEQLKNNVKINLKIFVLLN